MKRLSTFTLTTALFAILALVSCRKRDVAALADNLVNFEFTSQGLDAATNTIIVKVRLTRPTDHDIPVTLNLTEAGVSYGLHYTTAPIPVSGKINLVIPSGNSETSFAVSRVSGAAYAGDEKLVFDLYSSGSPVFIGAVKQLTLNFGELVSTAATTVINGGGANYGNKVFIDLSANRQTPVQRTAWDLGFYSGGDDYRVIINSSSAMMAKQIAKNDLTQVTAADTIGFSTDVAFSQAAPTTTSLPYIDYPNGDLTRTAIASISANAGDNKVYIINRGVGIGTTATSRGWKKIRVIRSAAGYTLQHADINSPTFTTVEIAKDIQYFFKYVLFETGPVTIEPQRTKWDIAWTYFSNVTNFGGGEVPYLFQDMIIQNRNVQIAKVLTSTKSFDNFTEADIAAQTFSSAQNSIGADWRSGGGPGVSPAVRTDRYYIIKDGDNNVYKVRFTALTQNGERGYPAFESVLVKHG